MDMTSHSAATGPWLLPEEAHPDGTVTFLELNDRICHWPHGEFPNYRYCGKPQFHRSYCRDHFRLSYVLPKMRWG